MGKGSKAKFVAEYESRRKGGGISRSNDKGKKENREKQQHKEALKATKKNVVGGVSRYTLSEEEEMKLMKLLAMLQSSEKEKLAEEIVEVAEINSCSDSDSSDSDSDSDSSNSDSSNSNAEGNNVEEPTNAEVHSESIAFSQLEINSDSDSDSDSTSDSDSNSNLDIKVVTSPVVTKSPPPEINVAAMARKLIRDGRRIQKEEKLKKVEDRNARKAVLRNMYNAANPPTPPQSVLPETTATSTVKESKLPNQYKKISKLSRTIRFQVKCEGKGNTVKLMVIDRNLPVAEIAQLLRNKYNVGKKYNSLLVTDSAFAEGNEIMLSEDILNEIQDEVNVTLVARASTTVHVQSEHNEVNGPVLATTIAPLESPQQELPQPPPITPTKVTKPLKSSSYRPYVPTRDEKEYNCDTPRVYPGDLAINEALRAAHVDKQQNSLRYRSMRDSRNALPIFQSKQELLDIIKHHQVSVVSGETGSGKSTQLPAYILDDMIESGQGSEAYIICTQPRRIAAISVAERVAAERDEAIGDSIGYQIRLNSRYDKTKTRILFCTTGVLLRKLHDISFLGKVSHILLDEVHERQVETDFLMTLLKKECINFPQLRIILMSATLQEELFGLYFNNCPVVHVRGRTFSVTQHFLPDINQLLAKAQKLVAVERGKVADMRSSNVYLNKRGSGGAHSAHADKGDRPNSSHLPRFDPDGIAELVVRIIQMYTPPTPTDSDAAQVGEGILVFLSGIQAIEKVNRILRQRVNATASRDKVFIYILHGSLPPEQQRRVFKKTKPGEWKVVLATNIAETSITVDDVTHVIDSGYMKEIRFDPTANISSLKECVISKAAARQRAGRAGRVRPGHCWKLYTSDFFEGDAIDEYPIPEIQRIPLEEVVLQVILLNLGLPEVFLGLCINPPSMAQIRASVQVLLDIKAILPTENLALTALGYHLAKMPVDVRLGKMLITAALLQVHEPILTICAALSGKSPFLSPTDKREEAAIAHRKYSMRKDSRFSDHLAVVNAYNDWRQAVSRDSDPRAYGFCQSNFLSANIMEDIHSLREYYRQYLVEAGFLPDKLADDTRATDPVVSDQTARNSTERHETDYAIVRCVLCAGLTPQVARVCRYDDKTNRSGKGKGRQDLLPIKIIQSDRTEVFIHPMSVAAKQKLGSLLEAADGSKLKESYLVYHTKVSSTKLYLYDVTCIPIGALLLFAGDIFISRQRERIIVDGWIHLKMSELHAVLYKRLQAEIDSMLVVKIENTSSDISQQQKIIHDILIELL
jgi:ATP-dependent RNA helicase DHX36